MPANDKRPVKVYNRSGFDKHFRNTLTGNVGTLIPILVDEVIPDTKVNLKVNIAASLPPLVSDTYMNVRLRVEAFAVPHRLCMGNFEEFFADYPAEYISAIDSSGTITRNTSQIACVPLIRIDSASATEAAVIGDNGVGSLTDYFGIPVGSNDVTLDVPVLPFVAYHLIWQEYYRNPRVQRVAFEKWSHSILRNSGTAQASMMPYSYHYFAANGVQPIIVPYNTSGVYDNRYYILADGTDILSLRQRNFGLDYFTAAMVEPQQGDAAVVKFGENGDPADGFSIASLRAMNSIQQFRERNNLTSPRYQQQIYARYGTAPSDGVLQRPVLIGAATYDVYSHGVTATAASDSTSTGIGPFAGSLGNRAGNAYAAGSDFLISGFHAKEPMFIMVLASLVPEVSYGQARNPMFNRYIGSGSITDMANGLLQNVGPQPILNQELKYDGDGSVFAYTDRYSDWMFKVNEVHGKFKYGENLQQFVLQRNFSSVPQFGSEFLEIPTDYLDGVLSVSAATMGFAYWMDCMLDYKVSMPLQEYAIPSLQDPGYEHGHTVVLRKNGQIL